MDIESYLSITQHTKKTRKKGTNVIYLHETDGKIKEIPLFKLKGSAAGYIKQRINDSRFNDPKLIHQIMFGH